MEDNKHDLAENKVLILYLLTQITIEITKDGLFKIVSSINNINYFYFQQYLNDLIQSNLVATYTKDKDLFLKITTEGKNALTLTKELLPGIIKLKADNIFKKELSILAEESSIITEFIPKDENNYNVICKVMENNESIFEIKTFAGNRTRAKKIADNWKDNAGTIYPQILNLLLNDNNK